MPSRDYDPRRYGPTVSTRVPAASRDVHSAPASTLREAWRERREPNDNLQFVKSFRSLRGTRAKRAGAGLWTDSQRAGDGVGVGSYELASSSSDDGATPKEDRFRRPGEARAALAPRSRATRIALSSKGPGATKQEPFHLRLYHTELSPFDHTASTTTAPASFESTTATADTTASASDTAGASPGARGRTRRRSLSWHLRQRMMTRLQLSPGASTYNSSSFCASPDANANIANSCYYSSGGGYEATTGRERVAAQKGRGRRRRGLSRKSGRVRERGQKAERGESIDAEELFRRKNKTSAWNVTYGRWAESYDRSMARRASLERRERLELQREESERRQRAEAVFQMWLRKHAPRSVSSSASGAATATATSSYASAAAAAALGPRSSYHERAASASPLRRQWLQKRQGAWAGGEGEGGDSGSESLGGSSNRPRRNDKEEAERERESEREREREKQMEHEEEKRRRVDRAFRAWLDRKKQQAQAEREAQRRREQALKKLRKMEASRRWKKRPVVCAYTYGAKIGARNWKDEPNEEDDDGDQHDDGKEEEGEEAQKQEDQEYQVGFGEEGRDGDGDGDGDRLPQEGWETEERTSEAGRRRNGSTREGESASAETAEEHENRAKDEDQRGGGVLREGETEDRGDGWGGTADEADKRAVG